jgi:8-oxo-dGTP diphosphatase
MTLKIAPNGVIEKVALLHFNDARQVMFARSRGQTLSYTLGGKVDHGETLEQALARECKEEGDIDLIPGTIRWYFTFEGPCHGYVEGTILKMHCFTAKFTGIPRPMNEVEELVYLGDYDIGKGKTTEMGDKILDHLATDNLIGPQQID